MNDASLWLAVATGGALGALFRGGIYAWLADWSLAHRTGTGTRLGLARATLVVNFLGSFLLGMGLGWLAGFDVDDPIRMLWVTGFCGSLTTFSTFCADTIRLSRDGLHGSALGFVLANVVLCLAAFSAGLVLAN